MNHGEGETDASTRLCTRLGITYPIVQAPIGSASCPALAAAVSNAGGLGTIAVSWRTLQETTLAIREMRARSTKPFAVNVVLAWPQQERMTVCLAEGVRLYSFFWGDPRPYLRQIRDADATGIVSIGSVDEARRAVDEGADIIVAQGIEAGGHVRGNTSITTLLPEVVNAIAPVPVLAAGGIGDGRGIAVALERGAAGVWMGTRFLATNESNTHPAYRDAVVTARAEDTVHGVIFDGGWPDAPHRVIRNRTVASWESAGRPPRGARPDEDAIIAYAPDGRPLRRYGDDIPTAGTTGNVRELALYAGQSVAVVHDILPAGELLLQLWNDARDARGNTR